MGSPSCTTIPAQEPHPRAKTLQQPERAQAQQRDPGMEKAEVEGKLQPLKWRWLVLLQLK